MTKDEWYRQLFERLDNDINNWIHYYAYTFIIPIAKGEENEAVNDLSELYAFVLTGKPICTVY